MTSPTPKHPRSNKPPSIEEVHGIIPWYHIVLVYIAYAVALTFGYLEEYIEKFQVAVGLKKPFFTNQEGYAPLFKDMEYFWLRRMYQKIRDLFERPIASAPKGRFMILDRKSNDGNASFEFTGTKTDCLNLASYNYLGFAETSGPVTDSVRDSIKKYTHSAGGSPMEAGNLEVLGELERCIAEFVGKPAAIIFGMGYATNSTSLPAIAGGKGTLIISDSLNHNSLVSGCRASGSVIRVFKHNEPEDLERLLRNSIIEGQPRTRRPWKKIVIVVEGIYSMEGEILRLPEIVALKKKYKAYLYVDEAHSIGAIGRTGRGVCEYWGVDPKDVDILMGTFTKAFGSVGGYISGDPEFIDYLRNSSFASVYATGMSPACAQQALSALRVIMGRDGTDEGRKRIEQLHANANYFRSSLKKLGFHVFGDEDSPVVPMMVYHPAKMGAFSREMLKRGVAVVVVGFPVTPLLLSRVRFCISAQHTREQLEAAVKDINDLGELICLKFMKDNE